MTQSLQADFDAAGRQPPAETLNLEQLLRTGRRRKVRRRWESSISSVVALVLVVGVASALDDVWTPFHHGASGATGPHGKAVSIERTAPVAVEQAVDNVKQAGTIKWPVQWVTSTVAATAALTHTGAGAVNGPVYLIQITGKFYLPSWGMPPNAKVKGTSGSVILLTLPTTAGASTGSSILSRSVADLNPYGVVHYYAPVGKPVAVEHSAPAAVVQAVDRARQDGEVVWPAAWVLTTVKKTAALTNAGPSAPDRPVYAVEVQGKFSLKDFADSPNGRTTAPHGTVLLLMVSADEGTGLQSSIQLTSGRAPNLAAYGEVHYYTPLG